MNVEWDEAKRLATLRERGLDFADIAGINWSTAITRRDTRNDYGEDRYVTTGHLDERLCVIVWCDRGGAMRVISLSKANAREKRAYGET